MGHSKRRKTNKTNKILLAFLIIAIICAGVIFGYNVMQSNNNNQNQNLSDFSEENVTANAIEQDTTDNTTETENQNIVETTNTTKTTAQSINNNDVFGNYYDKAQTTLETMSLEEKVGQMFLARYPESGVAEEIKSENPGGYVLFGRDFENKTKSSMLNELTQNQENSKIKLALGVDEEGGTVVRVSSYTAFRSSKFKSPQQLWKTGYLQAILDDSKEKSALLKSIGLNMNLAPVADVPTKSSSFIYARSYGRGAEKTAQYVAALIKEMNADGMISTMKHFPGYGDNVDTHTGIAIDNRAMSTFESSDFLPFKSGIEAGAPTILVSHNVVKAIDSAKPASLSENAHKILREQLGFTGIIMTDDLAMDAVKTYVENGEAAVQAVLAGNDMIISSDFKAQKAEVLTAVKNGKITEDILNTAVRRILAWKYAYKIID